MHIACLDIHCPSLQLAFDKALDDTGWRQRVFFQDDGVVLQDGVGLNENLAWLKGNADVRRWAVMAYS